MRGWQLVLLTLGLLWGTTHSHCDCQDDDHGSFSLEFSEEVSLSGDLPGCPFTVHHHHHHDDGPDFSSGFLDLGEHHGSLHEEISAELELDVDNHHDHHDHDYDHSHHDHSYSHEHHPPDHVHDYDYEVEISPVVDDLLFYYRK